MSLDEIQTPESSNIGSASYNAESGEMTVRFNSGGSWSYTVPPDVWDGFKNSPSKGEYLHRQVKGRFGHRKN